MCKPQEVGLNRQNKAFLAQTTGLRGTCNVRTSEVTSYVLDGPVTRHLKLWFFNVFNPKSSNAQVLQDSKICNILKALKVKIPRFCNTHTHTRPMCWICVGSCTTNLAVLNATDIISLKR